MSEKENKAVIQRYYEALSAKDWGKFASFFAEDFIIHQGGRTRVRRDIS